MSREYGIFTDYGEPLDFYESWEETDASIDEWLERYPSLEGHLIIREYDFRPPFWRRFKSRITIKEVNIETRRSTHSARPTRAAAR